jgi:hypothetical protein
MDYRSFFAPEEAGQRIDQVLQHYRERARLPMFWQVGPFTFPAAAGTFGFLERD